MNVVALVPAHDEAAGIAATISSLRGQTRPPEWITVVADNCSDDTAGIARGLGVEVIETVGNTHKKAGALNFALTALLSRLGSDDLVLAMDADSTLGPRFIEIAVNELRWHTGVGAVGGNFYGAHNTGLIRRMQCNEYARFARQTARKRARAWVLTGTGTMFRAAALRQVVTARRDGTLPWHRVDDGLLPVYDTAVLTEDNELTLALKHLGWRCSSPRECTVSTDVMPTWGTLWSQRLRWKRGAMENLLQYGSTRVTRPYIGQHAMMFFGIVFLAVYFLVLALTVSWTGGVSFNPLWLIPLGIFMVERAVTVRHNGWRNMALAAALLPEWWYEIFMQGCLLKAVNDILTRRTATW